MDDPATPAADDVPNAHRPEDVTPTGGSPAGQTAAVLQPVCWLAAYAVGLAYTNHSDPTCIEQILHTHASARELRRAHQMLSGWDILEGGPHRRALWLIEQALSHHSSHDHGSIPRRPPPPHREPA